MLIGYMVYFNTNRHHIEELENRLPEKLSIDDFYIATSLLGESLSDEDAVDYFARLALQSSSDGSTGGGGHVLFDVFLSWMAKRYGIEAGVDDVSSDEENVELVEGADILSSLLQKESGQYGDVHLQELTSLMGKHGAAAVNRHKSSGSGNSKLQFQALINKSNEKLQMVKNALRFSIKTNSCFPDFQEHHLIKFVQLMVKQGTSSPSQTRNKPPCST